MLTRYRFHFGPVFSILLLIVLFNGCKKDIATTPDAVSNVVFLCHKGSGSTLLNPSVIENTLPAVQTGLKFLPGVELDIQMSLDGTPWIFHNLDLSTTSCTPITPRTIILSHDAEISKINICSSIARDRIYKLSEIISYWNQAATPFYISFHIKLDYPPDSMNSPAIGGESLYLAKLADNIAKVIPSVKSPGKIMIEVYDATFCNKIHQLIPGIKVHLQKDVTFTRQIDDALALNYDGVSSIFTDKALTAAEVTRAQKGGLMVQLWTPDNIQELTDAYNYHPDFIQTDNLDVLEILTLKAK